MKLCRFGEGRLGLVEGVNVRDVTAALEVLPGCHYPLPTHDVMIAHLDQVLARVKAIAPAARTLPLAGLKLIGFSVWERRGGTGRNVTFPARAYSVNGERRSFALLRPIVDATAQDAIRDRILEAYAEYEAQATVAEA